MVYGPDAQNWLPRIDGPTVALVANPSDPFGTLLILTGRTEQELGIAATALATNRVGFAGLMATAQSVQPALRKPYDAPRWLPTGGPVSFGALVDKTDLQSYGYAPGPIRIPLRTAPDLFTWRNLGLPVTIRYRAPPAPIVDTAVSRLDVSVSDSYLRSLPLSPGEHWWPIEWALQKLSPVLGAPSEVQTGNMTLPPYRLFGRDELQLRFDMRPLSHGECTGVPGDIHASIDPDSTIDISRAYRFTQMPNVGLFASAGFPFTRLADLSGTAAILPERPTPAETGAFLDTIGFLANTVGLPSTGIMVATPGALSSVASRDLLVFGVLGRQPALTTLLRDGTVQVTGGRLTASLPDSLQDLRAVLLDNQPDSAERNRVVVELNDASEGMGAIIGVQSPLQAGRSVVALTGATQAGMTDMAAALRDPEQSGKIQGDISLINGGRISAFRDANTYEVGDLPLWLRAQLLIGGRPERAGLILLATACLIGIPFFWMLRRRATQRLRARSKE
jgi:cellulose synthase (UDP-forming)